MKIFKDEWRDLSLTFHFADKEWIEWNLDSAKLALAADEEYAEYIYDQILRSLDKGRAMRGYPISLDLVEDLVSHPLLPGGLVADFIDNYERQRKTLSMMRRVPGSPHSKR